ncbi:MAG: hypothetical protein HZA54_12515 [Planctomycetes bacterium]|nr:hypothetical protein [Planctomycetota bacterium]
MAELEELAAHVPTFPAPGSAAASPPASEFLQTARFGLDLVLKLARHSVAEELPMKLDY